MTLPSVIQGLIETEKGKVFELDSPKGSAWLESIGSFRFEPSSNSKAYTVRKEAGIYWYGCRKVLGKVRKKYIGKSLEVTVAKLEEIAEALEIPPVPRANKFTEGVAEVAQKVVQDAEIAQKVVQNAEGVAEVAQKVVQDAEIAQKVVQNAEGVAEVAQNRLTALELQVVNLQKAVKALQDGLLGKLEAGDSLELPKVDNEVVEELQNELSNLKAENEKLRADCRAFLESNTHITTKLRELHVLRSQLEAERADREEIEAELSELKQKSAAAGKDLPEAADLLNQLKAKRKKSKTDLADMKAILEILEN
jgi:chromosome segregation ATPase